MNSSYSIGIVDDDHMHVTDIMRVLTRYGKIKNYTFNFIDFFKEEKVDYEKLVQLIFNSIKEQKIDCLIIDYKLLFEQETDEGADIINRVKDVVPEFPAVILTGRQNECCNDVKVDPDKTYSKKEFLAIDTDTSNELVKKILHNIDRAKESQSNLKFQLEELKKNIVEKNGDVNSVLEQIIMIESRLDKYCMMGQSEFDKIYNSSALEKVVTLLEKANKLIN